MFLCMLWKCDGRCCNACCRLDTLVTDETAHRDDCTFIISIATNVTLYSGKAFPYVCECQTVSVVANTRGWTLSRIDAVVDRTDNIYGKFSLISFSAAYAFVTLRFVSCRFYIGQQNFVENYVWCRQRSWITVQNYNFVMKHWVDFLVRNFRRFSRTWDQFTAIEK